MASGQTARERTDLNCSKSRQINNFEADGRSNIYQNQVEFSTMLRKVSRSTCRSSFALFLVLGASLIIIDISLSERATCHLIGSTVSKLKIERELFVVGLDIIVDVVQAFMHTMLTAKGNLNGLLQIFIWNSILKICYSNYPHIHVRHCNLNSPPHR